MSHLVCQHEHTEFIPDKPDLGYEDGHWLCFDCGATKEKAYRPSLEHWEGGDDLYALETCELEAEQ